MARLGDVVRIEASSKSIVGDRFWLLNLDMVEQQTGNIIDYNYVERDALNGSIIQFDTSCVLYSKLRPNLNKVVIPSQDGFATSEMLPLRPNAKVLTREYLAVFLRSDNFVIWAVSKTAGAKMPRLGTKELLSKEIPLPSLLEQARIAGEFAEIDKLITLRKEQLAKLDQLVKSRFIELFGGADYPKVLFENVCVFLRNGASIKQTKGAGGYPITRIETLSNDVFNIDRLGYADITDLEKYQSYVLHNGDILISHINSVAYLGRAVQYRGQLDTPIIHGMNLLCARIADSYNPTYIEWFFKTPMAKEYISTITKKAVNQASITTSDLKKMQVPNPPKNLQDQFAAFVEQTDKSKLAIQRSLDKLELLKKTLMQEYFG